MSARPVSLAASLSATASAWLRRHMPTRERLERNRHIRPFAHRVLASELWRFTRRSVPRGVALGIFIGVTIPFAHSIAAALLAVFVRANVPTAIVATWVSNPLTWPLMWPIAYRIGHLLLHLDTASGIAPMANSALAQALPHAPPHQDAVHRLLAHHHPMLHRLANAGLATASGLVVEGLMLAASAYVLSSWCWRWWIARRRHRLLRARAVS